eukprot:45558-Rhodomonas_salina.1
MPLNCDFLPTVLLWLTWALLRAADRQLWPGTCSSSALPRAFKQRKDHQPPNHPVLMKRKMTLGRCSGGTEWERAKCGSLGVGVGVDVGGILGR